MNNLTWLNYKISSVRVFTNETTSSCFPPCLQYKFRRNWWKNCIGLASITFRSSAWYSLNKFNASETRRRQATTNAVRLHFCWCYGRSASIFGSWICCVSLAVYWEVPAVLSRSFVAECLSSTNDTPSAKIALQERDLVWRTPAGPASWKRMPPWWFN